MIAATKAVRVHDSRKPIIDLSVGSPGFPPHTFRRFLTGPFEGLTEISPRLCQRSLTLRQHPYLLAEPVNDRQTHDDKRIFNVVGATPSRVSRATRIIAGVVHGIGRPPEIQVRALKAQFPVIGQRRVETAPLQARWRSVQRINRRGGPIEQISPRWGTSKGRILIASSARDARGWRRALLSGGRQSDMDRSRKSADHSPGTACTILFRPAKARHVCACGYRSIVSTQILYSKSNPTVMGPRVAMNFRGFG